jgi:hypothetical protein
MCSEPTKFANSFGCCPITRIPLSDVSEKFSFPGQRSFFYTVSTNKGELAQNKVIKIEGRGPFGGEKAYN